MKISDHFSLGKTQHELDFVNIDTDKDTPLFLDPYFISTRKDPWSLRASHLIKSYFSKIINLLSIGKSKEAEALFSYLSEPNETCLGVSLGKPSGRGVGKDNTKSIFSSLARSGAVSKGVLADLRDVKLFVDGVDLDKISDVTTNILRGILIKYTQDQCRLWGIPLRSGTTTGYVWDDVSERWEQGYDEMLVIGGRKIILVPKNIVCYDSAYSPEKYYRNFVLEFMQYDHISRNTNLVKSRKNGTLYVTKKDLQTIYPYSKEFLTEFTVKHPKVFTSFKNSLDSTQNRPESAELDEELTLGQIGSDLINRLDSIPSGNEHATQYHNTVLGALEFIFYPHLTNPVKELEVHDGRKRVDIVFDNTSIKGVFKVLQDKHSLPCPYILVECKNYSTDVRNPELDQIAGRFSPKRGKVGILVSRNVQDLKSLLKRCADTHKDDRGLVIPLFDEDLKQLIQMRIAKDDNGVSNYLLNLVRKIVV